jgi:hypothetical protein
VKRMNLLQKSVVVTVLAFECLRLSLQFFVPYNVLVDRVHCGPWIVSFFTKAVEDPCRRLASGRIKGAFVELGLTLVAAFILVLVIGARGDRPPGGGGGGSPPDDPPRRPSPSPVKASN